jgi:hypothetical protein
MQVIARKFLERTAHPIQQLGLIWYAARIANSRTVSGKNHSRLMGVPNLSSFRTPEFQADAGELEFTP